MSAPEASSKNWTPIIRPYSGVLGTAGGLLFMGDIRF
jgi:hypothetical protein